MTVSYRDGVSIGLIVVYIPALLIALYLAIRHGFTRSAGWMFLIIFALARIIGACMQLATISKPDNINLYIGYAILQNIGLSPLLLASMGLLSRLADNINKTHYTFNTRIFKFIELIIMVALILAIVGGVNAGNNFEKTGIFTPSTLNKAGTALFIVSYVATVVSTIFIAFSIGHASHGEKRILTAIALSLPFLLVRLVYSILNTFDSENKNFNLLTGSVTVVLCIAFIEEFIVVVIFEGIGLTLPQLPKEPEYEDAPIVQGANGAQYSAQSQRPKPSSAGQKFMKVAKYTIIGRIVMAFIPDKKHDVEMQPKQYVQQAGRK